MFIPEASVLAYPARPFAKTIRSGFILLQLGIGFGIIRGAIDDIRAADRSLFDTNRYLPDRPELLEEELNDLKTKTSVLARTPLDSPPVIPHQ